MSLKNLFDFGLYIWTYKRWELFLFISILLLIIAYFTNGRNLNYKYKGVKLTKPRKTIKKKHENECKRILEKIFNRPFISIRPHFLRNPSTGRNLELDVYNEELHLALEYNGVQHRKFSPFFHRKYDDFLKQQERDLFKKQKCAELNIQLIQVPDTVKFEHLETYIRDEILKLNVIPTNIDKQIKIITESNNLPDPISVLQSEIKYSNEF